MGFLLPTISIDLSWFISLGQKSMFAIMWYIFIYGGWIPLVYVCIKGGLMIWLREHRINYVRKLKFVLLAIDIPKGNEQSPKSVEYIFAHMQGCKSSITFKEKWLEGRVNPPVSAEIVSIEGYTQFLVHVCTKYRNVVEAAFYAQYPDAEIVQVEDYVNAVPHKYPDEEYEWWGGEITLKKGSAYPIRTYPDFEHKLTGEFKDPMANFLESMSSMGRGEQCWMQINLVPGGDDEVAKEGKVIVDKFMGREKSGKQGVLLSVLTGLGDIINSAVGGILGTESSGKTEKKEIDSFRMLNLTPFERKALESLQEKMAKPMFKTKIRWVYYAKKEVFSVSHIYGHIKGFMKQYSSENGLTTYKPSLTKGDYFWQKWWVPRKKRKLMASFIDRDIDMGYDPVVLNIEELATLYHFPQLDVKTPTIKKTESRRSEPPITLPIERL